MGDVEGSGSGPGQFTCVQKRPYRFADCARRWHDSRLGANATSGPLLCRGTANGPFIAIDHMQLAMPRGGEEAARAFFVGLLGMTEVAKPRALANRGGCWFASGNVQVHLGVEERFRPARKAHPALRCGNYSSLLAQLSKHGIEVTEADDIPGVRRCYVFDPFGNRIELIDGGGDTDSGKAHRPDSSV